MQLLQAIALIAIVVGASAFIPGKQYVYDYNGRVFTGIPELKEQLSGFSLRSKLVIEPKDSTSLLCWLKDIKVSKFNQEVTMKELWTEEFPVEYSPLSDKVELLEKPFIMKVKTGVVTSMEVDHSEPDWVVNMRKGVANMIQMNYKGINRYESEYTHEEDIYSRVAQLVDKLSFEVMEETMGGICEVTYTKSVLPEYLSYMEDHLNVPRHVLEEIRSADPTSHMIITKTVNYEKCIKKSVYYNSLTCKGSVSGDCNELNARTMTTFYLLEGDLNSFVMKAILSHGEVLAYPLEHDSEMLRLTSIQTLILRSMIRSENRPVPSSLRTVKSIVYEFTKFSNQYPHTIVRTFTHTKKEESVLLESGGISADYHKIAREIVPTLLEQISNSIESTSEIEKENNPLRMTILKRKISQLSFQELKKLYIEVIEPMTQSMSMTAVTKKSLFLDVLTMSSTTPCIRLIIELIEEGKLSGEMAVQSIMHLPANIKVPTTSIIKLILSLVKHPRVTSNKQLYSSVVLALSNIVYTSCTRSHFTEKVYPTEHLSPEEICTPQHPLLINEIIPFLASELASTHDVEKKITLVQALSNIGHPSTVKVLAPYITGTITKSLHLRSVAIVGLKRLSISHPTLVQSLVMPIFRDIGDHYDVRCGAVAALLRTRPSRSLIVSLATSTWTEPSNQVKSFIFTAIKQLATTEIVSGRRAELQRVCQVALLLTKPVEELGSQYSHVTVLSDYLKEIDTTSELVLSSIGNTFSVFPRSLFVKTEQGHLKKDYMVNPLEASFYNEGTQKLINAIFGPEGVIPSGEEHSRVRRSVDTITDLKKELEIESRVDEPIRGRFWMRMFGTVEREFHYSESSTIIKDLMESGILRMDTITRDLKSGVKINYQRTINLRERELLIPTELGFPFALVEEAPLMISLRGTVRADITPEQLSNEQHNLPKEIELYFSVKPVIQHTHVVSLTIISPITTPREVDYFSSGIESFKSLILPAEVHIKSESRTQKTVVMIKPIPSSLKTDLVYMRHTPFTSIVSMLETRPLMSMRTISVTRTPFSHESVFGHELMGLNFKTKTVSEESYPELSNFYLSLLKDDSLHSIFHKVMHVRKVRYSEVRVSHDLRSSETKEIKITINKEKISVEQEKEIQEREQLNTWIHEIESEERKPEVEEVEQQSSIWNYFSSPISQQTQEQEQMHVRGRVQVIKPNTQVLREIKEKITKSELKSEIERVTRMNIMIELSGVKNRVYNIVYSHSVKDGRTEKRNIKLVKKSISGSLPFEVCFDYNTKFPMLPPTSEPIKYLDTEFSSLFWSKLSFSLTEQSCNSPDASSILIGSKFVRSEELKKNIQESKHFKECEQDMSRGLVYSNSCVTIREYATLLNSMTTEIKFSKVPKSLQYVWLNMLDIFRVKFSQNMITDPIMKNPSDKVVFKVEVGRNVANIITLKPEETVVYKNIMWKSTILSPLFRNVFVQSVKYTPINRIMYNWLGRQIEPMCKIHSNEIRTFDNVTLKMEELPEKCLHLLAKDCSNKYNMAILGRHLSKSTHEKEVEVLLGEKTKIVLTTSTRVVRRSVGTVIPSEEPQVVNMVQLPGDILLETRKTKKEQDSRAYRYESRTVVSNLKIVVNGHVETIDSLDEVKTVMESSTRSVLATIRLLSENELVLTSPKYRFSVHFDGKNIKITMSNMYRNRMCGVCGDLNGEKFAELKGPKKCVYSQVRDFFRSYIIKDELCNNPEKPVQKECILETYVPTGRMMSPRPSTLRLGDSEESYPEVVESWRTEESLPEYQYPTKQQRQPLPYQLPIEESYPRVPESYPRIPSPQYPTKSIF